MSSLPGTDLEDFVMWMHGLIVEEEDNANPSQRIAEILGFATHRRPQLTKEQFAPILTLYEPYREYVEYRLNDFDEETQSWRDYAGYRFDEIPDFSEQVNAFLVQYGLKP